MTDTDDARQVRLHVPGDASSLALVRAISAHLAADAGFEPPDQHRIENAVYEVVENVLMHAYESISPKPPIEIVFTFCAEQFQIDVIDRGDPFDFRCYIIPRFPDHWESETEHGLGLFVIEQCMDETHYEVLPNRTNRFRLTKRFTEKA